MTVEFLTLDAAAEANFELPDVYYSPRYGSSAELLDGGVWECAIGEGGRHFYPYIKRHVEPDDPDGEYDIVSPYGYAGVAQNGSRDVNALADFRQAFLDSSRSRGLIAEFIRTNPYDVDEQTLEALGVDSFRAHPTFSIAIGDDVEDYWTNAEGRHRTAVRKAGKAGVTTSAKHANSLLDPDSGFRTIYDATMDRVGASRRLRVGSDYFDRLVATLGSELVVIDATIDDIVCASAIFMVWGDRTHYHLSGSSPEGLRAGATNAILDHAARSLIPAGGKMHLGGGLSSGDGLEKFKRSAATDECHVYLCQTVVNSERYGALSAQSKSADAGYFPIYRG